VKRAVVTLAHPAHAGMLRALGVLEQASGRHGWEMHYVCSATPAPVAGGMLPPERLAIIPGIGAGRRTGGRLRRLLAVRKLTQLARGADVLYSVTLSSFPPCVIAGRRAGVPPVVHVYSSYVNGRSYRKHGLARARHVIAPSADSLQLARAALGGFAPGTRTHVVYNGQDVPGIRAAAADPLPSVVAESDAPTIGMVGNLDTRKDPGLLVEAAALVRRAVPNLRVLLVGAFGDPTYEAKVRARIAALGLEQTVVVTGFLSNPFPVVRRLDVLVHPAHRDPFPLALLEAMALARPIVASAVGGIPEMLVHGESALLVPPADPVALAAGITALLGDDARRDRIGAAAAARLTTRFTLDNFAAQMFAAFDTAVADGVG
jgi:glycosyltransferase involved in cell wall biosynthesis